MSRLAELSRAGLMAGSLAVITLMGGRALLAGMNTAYESTPTSRVVASHPAKPSGSPSRSPSGSRAPATASATPGGTPGATVGGAARVSPTASLVGSTPTGAPGGTATTLTLTRMRPAGSSRTSKRVVLRAELLESASGMPVVGRVTLWRRTRSGAWKAVLAARPTSSEGVVVVEVDQSGPWAEYRMTFTQEGAYRASVSHPLRVSRR